MNGHALREVATTGLLVTSGTLGVFGATAASAQKPPQSANVTLEGSVPEAIVLSSVTPANSSAGVPSIAAGTAFTAGNTARCRGAFEAGLTVIAS